MSPIEQSLMAFTLAAALLTVTPGLDTALVLRTAAVDGRRSAFGAALGICAGCVAWGSIVAVGLGALLAASSTAYMVLKWIGAAYLAYLGIRLLLAAADPKSGGLEEYLEPNALGSGAWFRRGLLTNLLNPKVGVFYVAFLPQFIPPAVDVAMMSVVLATIHAGLGLAWFALLILATARVTPFLRRPRALKALDRLTGGLFLLFAARLAVAER